MEIAQLHKIANFVYDQREKLKVERRKRKETEKEKGRGELKGGKT